MQIQRHIGLNGKKPKAKSEPSWQDIGTAAAQAGAAEIGKSGNLDMTAAQTSLIASVSAACTATAAKLAGPTAGVSLIVGAALCPLLAMLIKKIFEAVSSVSLIKEDAAAVTAIAAAEIECFMINLDKESFFWPAFKDLQVAGDYATAGGRLAAIMAKVGQRCGLHPYIVSLILARWYQACKNPKREKKYLNLAENVYKTSYIQYVEAAGAVTKILNLPKSKQTLTRKIFVGLYRAHAKDPKQPVLDVFKGINIPAGSMTYELLKPLKMQDLCGSNAALLLQKRVGDLFLRAYRKEPFAQLSSEELDLYCAAVGVVSFCGLLPAAAVLAQEAHKRGSASVWSMTPPRVETEGDTTSTSPLVLIGGAAAAYLLLRKNK